MTTRRVNQLQPGDTVTEKGFRPFRVLAITRDGTVLHANVQWMDGDGGIGRRMWTLDSQDDEVEVADEGGGS